MQDARPTRTLRAGLAVAVLSAAAVTAVVTASPAGADTLTVTGTKVALVLRGNGHGHGMSQYGARGAAIAGRTYKQIVAFYYPSTTLKTLPHTVIRVRLSNAGTNLQVAPAADLIVTGVKGVLPSAGVAGYRLLSNSATGTRLQVLKTGTGATWHTIYGSLPNRAEFHRASYANIRMYEPDGSSTDYSGYLRAVRVSSSGTAGGVMVVNRSNLENYTAGVIPQEMPTSWERAAVDAQAVAARTYGEYAVEHPQNKEYDICDTTSCQVYGGIAHRNKAGTILTAYYPRAATDTAGQVLQYQASTIFAQFSASDGGWTVDGGKPYLAAKADPYDNAASGDPYRYYKRTVSLAPVASYYGLTKITKFEITQRDGNGPGGGRVLVGRVTGTNKSGGSVVVATTGNGLAAALGVGTTWIGIANA